MASALALLMIAALATWTLAEKPLSASPHGRIDFTIVAGNLTLTGTSVDYHCTNPSIGAPSGELSIQYEYRLSNLGDSGIAVTVFLRVGNSSVAQHAYSLAPHQAINDTIGIVMTYDSGCESLAAGLGLSATYPG